MGGGQPQSAGAQEVPSPQAESIEDAMAIETHRTEPVEPSGTTDSGSDEQ